MVVEDVHIVQPEAFQGLIKAGSEVFARTQVAVRSWPHLPAGLSRDDQFVTVWPEVLPQNAPGVDLRGAIRRTVVVRDVEVGDAKIECASSHGSLCLQRLIVAEVVPEAQRHGW
jgi:hypothetical protein